VAKKYYTRRIPSQRKLFNKVKDKNNITWKVAKSVNAIVPIRKRNEENDIFITTEISLNGRD
jgi:hypothetical protein